jgi:hypothetical protein
MILNKCSFEIFGSDFLFKNLIFFFFSDFVFLVSSNFVFVYNFYFSSSVYGFLYYRSNFYSLFRSVKQAIYLFGNFFFFEMFLDGLYYRIKFYKEHNVLGFILGFNHYILYYLPVGVFAKVHMKRRRFFLYGLDKLILSNVLVDLVNLKFPNLFKGRGVKFVNKKYRLKLLKKKK